MKTVRKFILAALAITCLIPSANLFAQDEEADSPFDLGVDMYSSYIWRGAKFGSGPAFQPWVEAGFGGLAIGAWGSVNSSFDEALEMDLYIGYSFDFGLSLTVTDYYFGGDWMEFNTMHYIEPSIGFEAGNISFLAAYMLMAGTEEDNSVTPVVPGTNLGEEGDTYLELGYSFENVSLAFGLGDGAYTATDDDPEGGFNVCNITLGTSKEIEITEKFSLPLSGSVTLNPTTGGFFATVGMSF